MQQKNTRNSEPRQGSQTMKGTTVSRPSRKFKPSLGLVDHGTLHEPWTPSRAVLVLVGARQCSTGQEIRARYPSRTVVLMKGRCSGRGRPPSEPVATGPRTMTSLTVRGPFDGPSERSLSVASDI
uniref:Uncharacterized protein n=1 Tax=Solanum tuberosum TaxID=4113 RepID=M1DYK2_SOLTU